MEFVAFPKIPRLRRNITITEKIDGTNACIVIERAPAPDGDGEVFNVFAQSRKRIITPTDDNFGFAAWVGQHELDLLTLLGIGRHYGEWWGSGVQRGYGLDHKRFSLFDTRRRDIEASDRAKEIELYVVPLLAEYTMSDQIVQSSLDRLRTEGSQAAPGYTNPEGIVVRHSQSGQMYKVLLENDELPKSVVPRAERDVAEGSFV